MLRLRHAQVAMEFLMLIAFMMIMLVAFGSVVQGKIAEANKLKDHKYITAILERLENEVTIASETPSTVNTNLTSINFRRDVLFPMEVYGKPYTIKYWDLGGYPTTKDVVELELEGNSYVYYVPYDIIGKNMGGTNVNSFTVSGTLAKSIRFGRQNTDVFIQCLTCP